MLPPIRLRPILTSGHRHLHTTMPTCFKFKLTEDMSRQFEEKQKAEKQIQQNLAVTTKESSLLLGRVSHDRYKNVVKVAAPKHRLNEVLLLYRRENDDVQALDEDNISKPGDWVLLRKDPSLPDAKVTHRIEKVVHRYGHYVCPMTGRRSVGLYYDDDLERLEKIKVDL